MKLYIDTSSNTQTTVELDGERTVSDSSHWHSQAVLAMLDRLLKKKNKKITDLTEIEVNIGPGSYTGLRVGAAIANALGFALKIPVNGKHPEKLEIVEPVYE